MKEHIFYTAGSSQALNTAVEELAQFYTFRTQPDSTLTHLLLPVPSLEPDGSIIGGEALTQVLKQLPETVTVIGGNLHHHALSTYDTIDLLQDPTYLAQNASITAQCAIGYGLNALPVVLEGCPVLVMGFGRIGKCLALLLKQMGAQVTVAARKDTDRACALSLGLGAVPITQIVPEQYRLIYNTIPQKLLNDRSAVPKIELASGTALEGNHIIKANRLPGRHAPESSGKLIARTVIRLLQERNERQ